ncbi:Eco57I restriction-modification methylase domain-containing protein [uncultured Duncaniella sp.]|uniref:Eco57I restriction-modification methylase domain-containing protein n=1 Tax=uncultured Duncaniella sp. TaxID=2768039 RepID=UPI0025B72CD9|nr:Eco57I restriction-modification methylase domain-containing protein [uncultured Duncaniella sp.]
MEYFSNLKAKLIYVFRIPDAAHADCVKIGEATFEDGNITLPPNSSALNKVARARIDQYTKTAGISYELLHTEIAIFVRNGKLVAVNDKEVHDVLLRSGVKRKEFQHVSGANEWFCCDLETAKKAITAVKEGRRALQGHEISAGQSPIVFRPEQREAIDKTLKQFKKGNQMLWNAKMRFGKTLSALQVVKERGQLAEQEKWTPFRRVLILTHRPVVDAGWFEDFGKIFYDSPLWAYSSKNKGDSFLSLEKRARRGEANYIYFASMQDLRGSELVGGHFDKNNDVFSTPWDLIIVDEAHEGTQTELGRAVMKELTKEKTKVLNLSGTPFNLLDGYKEEEIYTWDYVMEQRAKAQWDIDHPGDHNPYAGLPRLNIYTYDLGRLMNEYADEDIAFNFREFFRTNDDGEFVHKTHVENFLDLLTKTDEESMYPFANKRYRDIFRHTLWMVPGVKSAKALSVMLRNHPVFGMFEIVNVAGEGDEEEANEEALRKVEKAIGKDPDQTRTITLSCGRLTTGVSVKPWTGVFMLSGSFNTAASAYMQTIFRVQTPATINGRVKEDCYVFDFAPDRTLKVLAETAKISRKAGKQSDSDRQQLADFLNFCPIISIEGSQMKKLDENHMLQQLKRVYVERVVQNGFEDGYLYNDELMKLSDVDIQEFDELKGIIGQTKAMGKSNDITVNDQGLTNEEYAEKEKLEKKKKRELTEEEKARLEELKKKKKVKEDAISILRGISIRMPLMIYGAKVENEDEELTIDNFTQLVDAQSWEEFMPRGVTKQRFNAFKKYYDPDIFTAAAKRIRAMARAADRLSIEERIERIAAIFATFRNPDKETVLTPWRVVNMHMNDTLGGYTFYNDDFTETIEEPRFVDRGDVTAEVFTPDSHLLEINSKSGLYPLYLAYNTYRSRLRNAMFSPETLEEHQAIWDAAVAENIFVICKTPMAKSITRRTLLGFRKGKTNMWAPEDLINKIKNQPELFIKKVQDLVGKDMKIKAIVGNPPYQIIDGGGTGSSAVPVYNSFVAVSQSLKPNYISMIMPAKWYSGGRGLDEFRQEMLNDTRMSKLVDFVDSRDVFPTVDIAGGICYFLWDADYDDDCTVVNISNGKMSSEKRLLNAFDTFIRDSRIIEIINKAMPQTSSPSLAQKVYASKPFGLRSFDKGFPAKPGRNIRLFGSGGISYLSESDVPQNLALAPKWKVIMSKASAEHAGQTDKEGRKRIVSRLEVLEPGTICTESYLLLDIFDSEEDARNMHKYMRTQFVRFLIGAILLTQNIVRDKFRFVPQQDFTANSDIDWSKSIEEIDAQLYAKYLLSNDEIAFIESMIKPM